MSVATVMRLRSRLDRPGRSHTWPKSTSCVSSSSAGATSAKGPRATVEESLGMCVAPSRGQRQETTEAKGVRRLGGWDLASKRPEATLSPDARAGGLLWRDRPADLLACFNGVRLALGGVARTANRSGLKAYIRRTGDDPSRKGKAQRLPRGDTAQRSGAAVVPADGNVHVERGSILNFGPGLIRGRDITRGSSAVTAEREQQQESRESRQHTQRSLVETRNLNLTLAGSQSPVLDLETTRQRRATFRELHRSGCFVIPIRGTWGVPGSWSSWDSRRWPPPAPVSPGRWDGGIMPLPWRRRWPTFRTSL